MKIDLEKWRNRKEAISEWWDRNNDSKPVKALAYMALTLLCIVTFIGFIYGGAMLSHALLPSAWSEEAQYGIGGTTGLALWVAGMIGICND